MERLQITVKKTNTNIKDNSKPLRLAQALHSTLETGFVAFCGAGVSIAPPSCSPSWWSLTEELILALFDNVSAEWGVPADLIVKDPNRQPEEVLENFFNMLETRLYVALNFLRNAQPNATHFILAKLAKMGILRACFTTNFDVFFEMALKEEGVDYEVLIDNQQYDRYFQQYLRSNVQSSNKFILCKIHGSVELPETIVSVASAYKTAKGFSLPKAAVFSSFLSMYPCLFLGYSGWDFAHLNYRRFWERAGLQVKRIIWNRKPGELGEPDFSDIFRSCFDRFEFCEGDLPADLVEFLKDPLFDRVSLRNLRIVPSTKGERVCETARVRRVNFFNKWVKGLSDVHKMGLVITESRNFSERFREFVQAVKEQTEGTDPITYDFSDKIQELAQKYGRQEITVEEYQQQTMQIQLEMQLRIIKASHRPLVLEIIQQNRYPGITDDNSNLPSLLSFIASLARWFEPNEAVILAIDYLKKIIELRTRSDKEAKAEQLILNQTVISLHPREDLWKPAVEQMRAVKEQYLNDEINYETFQKECIAIHQKALSRQMGEDIDYETLLKKQIALTAAIRQDREFEEQCEALGLTIMLSAPLLYKNLNQSEEYQNIILHLNESIPKENLDALDTVLRKDLGPVVNRAAKVPKGYAESLINMSVLVLWLSRVEWLLDPAHQKEYTKSWDNGVYPRKRVHKDIYNYLRQWVDAWAELVFEKLVTNPRFIQRFCGDLVRLAEMGDDFELCKRATLKSLELTEGVITEATPNGIPSALAAFYERQGDQATALKYYTMNLDAIKLFTTPIWGDVIIYRSALLTAQAGNKKKALEIIGTYHPEFYGNGGVINMPARKLASNLAAKLAQELGYSDAQTAVKKILNE